MITISSLITRIPNGISSGLIWGLLALGIYITFRILNISDLTVDSSFATGGAVCAILIVNNIPAIIALFVAFIVGCICGCLTGLIHTKLRIPVILSSILVQLALYSINLHIMNMSSNISLNPDKYSVLLTSRNKVEPIITLLIIVIIIIALLYWFFGTELGCAIRASGNNEKMALANGINTKLTKIIGLALSNGLVALAGGLLAQFQGFANINMGRGVVVIGIAAIIIGDVLLSLIIKRSAQFFIRFSFVVIGGIIYYLAMIIILWLRVDSNDLNLFTAILVALFLALGNLKKKGEN